MMNIEKLKKDELVEYCKSRGIDTVKKTKKELKTDIENYRKELIRDSIKTGNDFDFLYNTIEELSEIYATNLSSKIEIRKKEMKSDDNSHYLIYRVLGITTEEGQLIDEYQNTGRFLYKYAGSFLEEAASFCLKFKYVNGGKFLVNNNQGKKPKTFEIDFLNGKDAIELKWRDATTDGDHITKEHTRVQAIQSQGYIPIRVMFYYPQRSQAKKIQETLKTLYIGCSGQYYGGDDAWSFIKKYTGYDLKEILTKIADKRTPKNEDK